MATGYVEADCGLVPIRNTFLLPTAKLDDQKFEFYFLLDVSSSMRGKPIELAKRALTLLIQSLPEDCCFNIVTFNEHYSHVFPQSVKYSQHSLEQAKTAVDAIKTAWGTTLLAPLQYVYGCPQTSGYLTQIFIITDGAVSKRKSVLDLVASKAKHSRCFSLGIGEHVDRRLVTGIAKIGGGTHEFVTYNEMIETKILNQLKMALKPGLLKPVRDASAYRLIPMYEP